MDEINLFLKKFLTGKKKKEGYYNACLQLKWQQYVGDYIAQKSFPKAIKDDVLFLDVVSAGWAHNFLMIKEDILNKINSVFDGIIVKDIRFSVSVKLGSVESAPITVEKIEFPELDENEDKNIQNIVKTVSNKGLADKLLKVIKKDARRKKYFAQEGRPVCGRCGVILAYEDKYCCACEKNENEDNEKELVKTMFALPWLTFEQVRQILPVRYSFFRQTKDKCKRIFLENAARKDASRSDVQRYVMIATGLSAFDLTDDIVEETMKAAGGTKRVSAYRS